MRETEASNGEPNCAFAAPCRSRPLIASFCSSSLTWNDGGGSGSKGVGRPQVRYHSRPPRGPAARYYRVLDLRGRLQSQRDSAPFPDGQVFRLTTGFPVEFSPLFGRWGGWATRETWLPPSAGHKFRQGLLMSAGQLRPGQVRTPTDTVWTSQERLRTLRTLRTARTRDFVTTRSISQFRSFSKQNFDRKLAQIFARFSPKDCC